MKHPKKTQLLIDVSRALQTARSNLNMLEDAEAASLLAIFFSSFDVALREYQFGEEPPPPPGNKVAIRCPLMLYRGVITYQDEHFLSLAPGSEFTQDDCWPSWCHGVSPEMTCVHKFAVDIPMRRVCTVSALEEADGKPD